MKLHRTSSLKDTMWKDGLSMLRKRHNSALLRLPCFEGFLGIASMCPVYEAVAFLSFLNCSYHIVSGRTKGPWKAQCSFYWVGRASLSLLVHLYIYNLFVAWVNVIKTHFARHLDQALLFPSFHSFSPSHFCSFSLLLSPVTLKVLVIANLSPTVHNTIWH
jgi:hypothetical protein